MIPPSPPDAASVTGGPAALYRVGTLTYTRGDLLTMMWWMLLADGCLQIVERLQDVMPLQLKWVGANDVLIGFLTGTIPHLVSVILYPILGVWSDRHRGPLGRRRPFLLWGTPFMVLILLGLGFSSEIAGGLAPVLGISQDSLALWIIGTLIMLFAIVNTVILQVYQFLFVDVIPKQVMGKFIGLYRAFGAIGMFIFHRWWFGHADTHAWLIYAGAALVYAVSFGLLIWRVKEGEYPPLEPLAERKKVGVLVQDYRRECFGVSFYLKAYLLTFFFWGATVPFNTFLVFFCTKVPAVDFAPTLGLSLTEVGQIRGWLFLSKVPLFFCIGPVIDRFHPLRVVIVAYVLLVLTFFGGYFWVTGSTSFLVWGLVNAVGLAIFTACQLAVFPLIFPREKYGQFFTANQVVGIGGLIIAPVLCGKLLTILKDYRIIFLWAGLFTLAGLVAAVALFRDWKRLGGDENFVPPGSAR